MTEDEKKAFADTCNASLKRFFPQDFPETRFDKPTGETIYVDAVEMFGRLLGLALKFAEDKQNDTSDRVAALDVARKTVGNRLALMKDWNV